MAGEKERVEGYLDTSAAISLKRIADAAEAVAKAFERMENDDGK